MNKTRPSLQSLGWATPDTTSVSEISRTELLCGGGTRGSYVLVTPARNEMNFLPALIECVLSQTVLPAKWIIVNDNSTDRTEEIARDAARTSARIEVIGMSASSGRSFGSKARAFDQGYRELRPMYFDYVGNVDADVTFGRTYYEQLLDRMAKSPRLGVASGVILDKTERGFRRTISSLNHAVGAVQFWRRECYEETGGYKPVTLGGMDSLAERTARLRGWETRSFEELAVLHHKPIDSAAGGTGSRIAYRAGCTDYYVGTSLLFAVLKAIRRWRERPMILSTFVRLLGYTRLCVLREDRDAPDDLVRFLRKEEVRLLIEKLTKRSE